MCSAGDSKGGVGELHAAGTLQRALCAGEAPAAAETGRGRVLRAGSAPSAVHEAELQGA